MSKKAPKGVLGPLPEAANPDFDLVKEYQAREEQAKKNKRSITPGKNVPYSDVKALLDQLIAKLGKENIDVSQASLTITAILEDRYTKMETGMDRMFIKVGKELREMTKTEARDLRIAQLQYSKKNNNVYRMIHQIISR